MDFFGIIYDMKNGKKVPYSKTYFDTLFAAKLGDSDVKTITGTLPLTFRTSETALRSWTIYGADIEHVETASGKSITFYTDEDKLRDWTIYGNAEGVGERTKNLLEVTAETQTINGVTYTINDDGTVTVSGTATADSNILLSSISGLSQGDYILSGEKDINTPTVYTYVRGGGETTKNDQSGTGVDFSMGNYTECKLYVTRYFSGTVTVKPMIRSTNTTSDFIPYGYKIPLTISQDGQTDKNYDIFIGDSPLAEGETVSKTSTGVDIATADGNNTITTSLYNQPDMSITYNEFTGVGILTANLFMIALQLKAGGQTLNVFNTLMNKPLRAGETLTSEQTGQTINTVAGVENKLSPAPKVASYGGSFNMTIKYKE